MFIDTARVKLKAGKGGNGAVSFRREIYIPKGGPDGGDGGRGGSIIFRADKDTNTLLDFRYNPILTAEDGKPGSGSRSAGRSGKDLIVEVPIGTVVRKIVFDKSETIISRRRPEVTTEDERRSPVMTGQANAISKNSYSDLPILADLTHDGEEAIIAKGGDGGFGNAHFKSSTRQTPIIAEVGEPGEEFEVELELKLLADVGLVGLPNAGKSTFLSVVSNAKPEIADYPFTTLTPNLGVATIDEKDILIADIPGLIEGAAEGKGLGHDFLRHVDRTAVLLHLVDVYNNDAGVAYQTIRKELAKYSDLKNRPEIVTLTKCEGVDAEIIAMQTAAILAINPNAKIYPISSTAHQGITELLRAVKDLLPAKQFPANASSHPSLHGSSFNPLPVNRRDRREIVFIGNDISNGAEPAAQALDESVVETTTLNNNHREEYVPQPIPTISLTAKELKNTWSVKKLDDKFIVSGAKIEKFARRTDLNNYASVNRLRDIIKKLGIRAELTSKGAEPTSIISIAGKEFPLVEDY